MGNPFKKYRIDYTLFALSAGFVLLLVGVIAYTSYHYSSRELVNNTSRYQRALLEELNKQLNILLEHIEQTSLTASRSLNAGQLSEPELPEYRVFQLKRRMVEQLAQLPYSSPSLHSVDAYIPSLGESYILEGYASLKDHRELALQAWYPAVREADSAWIGQHTAIVQNKPVELISFARKMYSNAGQYMGTLVIHVKASAVLDILGGQADRGRAARVLLDSGNRVVTRVGPMTEGAPLDAYLARMDGPSGYVQVKALNEAGKTERYLLSWSRFYNTDWLLLDLKPWRQITAGSLRVAAMLLGIGLLGAIFVVFFALVVARQFTRPVSQLLSAMSHFAVKQEIVKLPSDYRNEYGAMFNGFQKLTEHVLELYASLRTEYRRKREAEITALQAMINPHFLYNTLDQVNWMAIESGQERISEVLELMGRMFRIGLSNGEKFITIRDEVEHMSCYLQIQRIRRGDGLSYAIDVDAGLLGGYVPKLILQPFVENAVLHGLHGRASGTILVSGSCEDGDIVFRIADDGKGIPPDWADRPKRRTGGYGIRNVAERLDIYYGEPYGIVIRPIAAGGTEVVIRIPFITDGSRLEERSASHVAHRPDRR